MVHVGRLGDHGLNREVIEDPPPAGLAIVATDVPGHRDVIVRDRTGLLVPAEDSAALAEAIASLVADPDRGAVPAEFDRGLPGDVGRAVDR